MTDREPTVPLRLEMTFELPGTAQQIWQAIATADGISSWFGPTDVEEREGGAIAFHMGPDMDSEGTVTGWDPPRRFAFVEPNWADLTGQEDANVTPMATEFLVEARSGGTCVVRVVSSAFGTGADWEREFFEEMEKGWTPFFDRLRLYLAHYAGQKAVPLTVMSTLAGESDQVWSAMQKGLGIGEVEVGETLEARDLKGTVVRVGPSALGDGGDLLLHVSDPVPGYVSFVAFGNREGTTMAMVGGQLFTEDAARYIEREEPAWQAWLESLGVPIAPTTS
jgi:uncharacterized protein YndB with AHSA1/START domain